jgi:NADP-dependent 3-hydroxy acid dehydrogenase YdfG
MPNTTRRYAAAGPKGQCRQMMDPDNLTGRIAVVTGGWTGPGAAMARSFAEVGMAVAALEIDEAVAECSASRNAEPKVRTTA